MKVMQSATRQPMTRALRVASLGGSSLKNIASARFSHPLKARHASTTAAQASSAADNGAAAVPPGFGEQRSFKLDLKHVMTVVGLTNFAQRYDELDAMRSSGQLLAVNTTTGLLCPSKDDPTITPITALDMRYTPNMSEPPITALAFAHLAMCPAAERLIDMDTPMDDDQLLDVYEELASEARVVWVPEVLLVDAKTGQQRTAALDELSRRAIPLLRECRLVSTNIGNDLSKLRDRCGPNESGKWRRLPHKHNLGQVVDPDKQFKGRDLNTLVREVCGATYRKSKRAQKGCCNEAVMQAVVDAANVRWVAEEVLAGRQQQHVSPPPQQ